MTTEPTKITHRRSGPAAGKRRLFIAGAAAAAVLAVGIIAVSANGGDDDDKVAAGPPLELTLPGSDALASCLPLEVGILADMSPAFAATATAVEGELVTLEVDKWYTGGDAEVVQLQAQAGLEALIDGFDFEVGQQYLITASEGNVNFCGYSGPASPELTAIFEEAFPG